MKFNFKKITSVLASAVMLGSTIGIAAAATSYPAPFVKGGVADVTIVFGAASPANIDFVAATDIGTSLSTALASQTTATTTTTSSTPTGGDSVKLKGPSDNLNMNDTVSDVWTTKIESGNLPTLLKDGTYRSKDNQEYKYTQYIEFVTPIRFTHFEDSDYKADTPTLGIRVPSSTSILNYTIDFSKSPRSDVDSSGMLEDLQDRDVVILGKTYKLLNAYNKSSATKFEFMRGSVTDSINLNEEKTAKVGDKSYTVTLTFVDATYSQFKVIDSAGNTQTTTKLAKGGTYKLADGTQLGVTDISYQAFSGGVMAAEFTLGADKITLEDGQNLKINDNTETSIIGWIVRSEVDANKVDIVKFGMEWITQNDIFVAPGSSPLLPGFKNLKFDYGGFVVPCEETVKVKPTSTYKVELTVPIKDGDATFAILNGNATDFEVIGESVDGTNQLKTSNDSSGSALHWDGNTDKYFVASWNDSTSAESYLLKFTTPVDEDGKNKTTLQNVITGEEKADKKTGDTITLGKVQLTIVDIDKLNKAINLSIGAGGTFNRIYSKGGLGIWLPYNETAGVPYMDFEGNVSDAGLGAIFNNGSYGATSFILQMSEEDKNGNIGSGGVINVTLGHAGSESEVTEVDANSDLCGETYKEIGSTLEYEGYVISDTATKALFRKPSSGQNTVDIIYHCGESYAEVYLTAPETVVSAGGNVTELGSVTKKDTELTATDKAKNLVVVGGSCVNTVAAKLLGSETPICAADFTTKTGVGKDQFLVQVFDNPYASGKVAMLVAGWEAADTKSAVTYATKETTKYATDVGTKKKLVTTTYTDVV